jgi:hypothetical protein
MEKYDLYIVNFKISYIIKFKSQSYMVHNISFRHSPKLVTFAVQYLNLVYFKILHKFIGKLPMLCLII